MYGFNYGKIDLFLYLLEISIYLTSKVNKMSLRTTNSGYGKEFYENGKLRYEGEWRNGEWNGNGKQFDVNGSLYD